MKIAVVVPFQDERQHLGRLLASLDRQRRRPDLLVLADDGSRDGSEAIADAFAADRPWVRVLHRPRRPAVRDRLAGAPEYMAFQSALEEVDAAGPFDVVGKLDGDLEVPTAFLETLERELEADDRLGIVGTEQTALMPTGELVVERQPRYHVRGGTKFYRRECLRDIQPCEAILGWDTIDEVTARMRGWVTRTVDVEGARVVHLRPVGSRDGLLRAYRRWGLCAYAAGYHPLWVALGATRRLVKHPYVLGGLAYAWGWIAAHVRGVPRARPEVRRYLRWEQMQRVRRQFTRQRM